jgi:hypothetical protein
MLPNVSLLNRLGALDMRLPAVACLSSICVAFSAMAANSDGPTISAAPQEQPSVIGADTPWQTSDGLIHFRGKTFNSWANYFALEELKGSIRHRCMVPELDVDAWRDIEGFLPPSDCSNSSTNPAEEYDPAQNVFRIPCVVHVIRNTEGTLGDIPIDRVISGIRILNEDMLALTGTNGENGTDCQIEFFLAEVDPNGNPTNGITFSNNTTWYNDGGNYYNSLAWDPNNYLNIYTNTASGNLGYVPFLPANGNVGSLADRVVVLWESYGENAPIGFPYNLGRTLTHEVGHYLGLNHTFNGCESGSCSTGGDLICDTAPQNSPTSGCTGSSCSGTAPDDNYMDYSYDECMEKFTPIQARRMRCTLLNWRTELPEVGANFITLSSFGTIPSSVPPTGTTLKVQISENEPGGYQVGTGTLHYSSGGVFQTKPLNVEGLGVYGARVTNLECGLPLEWFFTAEDIEGNIKRLPTGTSTFSTLVAGDVKTTFSDNAQTNLGYSVGGLATDGTWDIGVPVNCNRGDPSADGDGSGSCWLTDNSSANACNSDVDGGLTTLVTPEIDASGGEAFLSYYVWYDNTGAGQGASPGADVFLSEISSDGQTWVSLETIGPADDRSSGGWNLVTFRVADFVDSSGTVQIRFTADDAGEGSVIEAAIDGISLEIIICDDTPDCPSDVNNDDIVNGADLALLLADWNTPNFDLNNDGNTDGADLSLLLIDWGMCN